MPPQDKSEKDAEAPPNPLHVPGGVPNLVIATDALRLWHHQDTTFKVPKVSIGIGIWSFSFCIWDFAKLVFVVASTLELAVGRRVWN